MTSPSFFYQSLWDVISQDFIKLVTSFYNHSLDLKRINMASISLIPKKYMPILLLSTGLLV
jgi:hypothetical protein